jgi:hypothetical protein
LAFVNIAELTETTKVLAITKAQESNPLVEAMLEILDVCTLTDATSP